MYAPQANKGRFCKHVNVEETKKKKTKEEDKWGHRKEKGSRTLAGQKALMLCHATQPSEEESATSMASHACGVISRE